MELFLVLQDSDDNFIDRDEWKRLFKCMVKNPKPRTNEQESIKWPDGEKAMMKIFDEALSDNF